MWQPYPAIKKTRENIMSQLPLTIFAEFEIRKENTTAEQWVATWAERALDWIVGHSRSDPSACAAIERSVSPRWTRYSR